MITEIITMSEEKDRPFLLRGSNMFINVIMHRNARIDGFSRVLVTEYVIGSGATFETAS